MKYIDYDKENGSILGFYAKDIHGDNIPTGCIEISDEIWSELLNNQGKYIVDVAKASTITERTEIDNITDLFTDYVMPLADVQTSKISEIKEAYNQALIAGFTTNASGNEVEFSYGDISQTKFMKLMMTMNSGLLTYPTTVFGKDSSAISLTQEQLQQLFKDLTLFEMTLETKLHAYITQINNAITVDVVNAIIWE